jgi:hypothetical protein
MASHHLTVGRLGATSEVERYLAELAGRLRGPRAVRLRVLAEVRDGLAGTVEARLADGVPPHAAATAAIREFGDPETIAGSFAEELATASARRTIAIFILTGPLVGIWWLLLLDPAPWRNGIVAAVVAIPAIPLIALAIATAAGTYATTGRLMRWLPEASGTRALNAAIAIAVLCLAGDITVLCVLATHLATGWHGPVPLVAIAAAASFVRVGAATAAIGSIRRTRVAVGRQ